MKTVVVFGGTGFIGTHLVEHLLKSRYAETIYLVDLNEPREFAYTPLREAGLKSGKVVFFKHDVRTPIPRDFLPRQADVVFNLAAVHREPGHFAHEYFETNLAGAENVCTWASETGCETLVFTSSISPYGPSEEKRTETSIPAPATPYGSSKLGAEKIHTDWVCSRAGRKLLILRPGVVFGAGEGGNVTRLVRSLVRGYFVYLGNRRTIKAAGYVKELCLVVTFCLEELQIAESQKLLINFTMDPPPAVEDMVNAILRTVGKVRRPVSVPAKLLLGLSYALSVVERFIGVKVPINPVRVHKLVRSNSVWPEQLKYLGYTYRYTLDSAFDDWKRDIPEDFSA